MSRKKHVEQEYLQKDVQPPSDGQEIAMSLGTRGGNIVEVQFEDKTTTLCMIPAKFNKKLWIRRGGLVIIDKTVKGETDAKITGTVAAVLYPEHLKHFKKQGVHVPTFSEIRVSAFPEPAAVDRSDSENSLPDIPANPNKKAVTAVEYTDSESE